MGSIDIVGVKDGVGFTPGSNFEKSEVRQGIDVGVGVLGGGRQIAVKEEKGQLVKEDKWQVGTVLVEYEHKETTAVNENYELVGKPKTESGLRVPDLEFEASAIVGVKASLDLNKTWEALGRLLLDK